MKNKFFPFVAFFFVFVCCSSYLLSDFRYQVDLTSRYIWRGFDLNPNKQPALQPSFEYSCVDCSLTLNLWGSLSFNEKDYNEIDLSVVYNFKTSENFSLSAGFIHYGWYFVDDFSFRQDTTQEIFISAGLSNPFLHPKLTFFYDFNKGDGFYILLEAWNMYKLSKSIETNISASLGYNGGQWLAEGEGSGFSDLNLGIELLFKMKRFIISPFAHYTFVLLDVIGTENHFWFGISVIFK